MSKLSMRRISGKFLTLTTFTSFVSESAHASGPSYERISTKPSEMSWDDCVKACEEENMIIADVYSSAENKLAKKACGQKSSCWLGLGDKESEGIYTWSQSSEPEMCYSNWASGHPSGDENGKDCVQLNNPSEYALVGDKLWYETGCNKDSRCLCVDRSSPGDCSSEDLSDDFHKSATSYIIIGITCGIFFLCAWLVCALKGRMQKQGQSSIVTAEVELVSVCDLTAIAVPVGTSVDDAGSEPASSSEDTPELITPRANPVKIQQLPEYNEDHVLARRICQP